MAGTNDNRRGDFDWALYGSVLRAARAKKLGFKKGEEFAKRIEAEGLKMSKETLYKIEQGKQIPNAAQFIALNLIVFGESAPEKVMDLCMGTQWQGLREA